MHTARSASRAASPPRSAVDVTTTASMPSARQARTTRTAISPRLAMRTRRTGVRPGARAALARLCTAGLAIVRTDPEQHLLVLDHLGVLRAHRDDLAGDRRDDRVHQLHDLDDRQLLVRPDGLPDPHERRLPRA